MDKQTQALSDKYKQKMSLMWLGTGSDVGKSLLVAGICRMLKNKGMHVAPFKPQNMSNNAASVRAYDIENAQMKDHYGEIGRAQFLQAKASKIEPNTLMNPLLLKPESNMGSQIIINGERYKSLKARDYYKEKSKFLGHIKQSFEHLLGLYDAVMIEGAGSPAEANLRKNDIANLGFAEVYDMPSILIGDIDRGGVIASIIGTYHVLSEADRKLIKGFVINKFRGDVTLFDDGVKQIEEATGWPCLGVIPYFERAKNLPPEDSMVLDQMNKASNNDQALIKIAAPKLPHIANFDDFTPLINDSNIEFELVHGGNPLPQDADWIILPGSKSTIADLKYLYTQGWDIDLKAHHRAGKKILGLCGGYQMLGNEILDPHNLEGLDAQIDGLAMLDFCSTMDGDKTVTQTLAQDLSGNEIKAYEIHLGKTEGSALKLPLFMKGNEAVGAVSQDGLVMGSYLHGIFENDEFRRSFFFNQNAVLNEYDHDHEIEEILDELADHLEQHLDVKTMLKLSQIT